MIAAFHFKADGHIALDVAIHLFQAQSQDLSLMHWLYLAVAILSEVVATTALKAAEGLSRWGPVMLVLAGYGLAFYFLSLTLRTIPLGIAYAIWAGVGVALVSVAGWFIYRQALDAGAIIGITLIVAGVIVLRLFSKTVTL